MKWIFPIAAITLVLVVTMVSPNIANAQLNSALGSAHIDAADTQILINVAAHSGSLGENPFGHYHFQTVPGDIAMVELDADVTCLSVVGNLATVGGFVTQFVVNGVAVTGVHGLLQIFEDNRALGVPDAVSGVTTLPDAPSICPPPNPAAATFVINRGNIVVHDAGL